MYKYDHIYSFPCTLFPKSACNIERPSYVKTPVCASNAFFFRKLSNTLSHHMKDVPDTSSYSSIRVKSMSIFYDEQGSWIWIFFCKRKSKRRKYQIQTKKSPPQVLMCLSYPDGVNYSFTWIFNRFDRQNKPNKVQREILASYLDFEYKYGECLRSECLVCGDRRICL